MTNALKKLKTGTDDATDTQTEPVSPSPPVATAPPPKPEVYESRPTSAALGVPALDRRPAEFWCEHLGTPDWLFAGTKLGQAWPIGKELTRADYEKAVKWAATAPSR